MKKRIFLTVAAAAMCVSMLGGCAKKDTVTDEPLELKQAVYDISGTLAEMRTLTAPKGALTGTLTHLTDEEGEALTELFEAYENIGSGSETEVEERDWSIYASPSAKSGLSGDEATLYDRLYKLCESYLNDPSDIVSHIDTGYISSDTVDYSDLEITDEQIKNVYWWFRYSNPQFYFLGTPAYTSGEIFLTVSDFVLDLPDRAKATNELFGKLDGWIEECSRDGLTAMAKIVPANKKICENTKYSSAAQDGDGSAFGGKNLSIYSVLMTEDTVSAGYALTFSAMANALGIETYTVYNDIHAWNAAKFDDDLYYFIDVCNNDGENGYSESFIGMGTDYADFYDNGSKAHALSGFAADCVPMIPARSIESDGNVGSITAPELTISGIGHNLFKIDWEDIEGAEKYEWQLTNGSKIYSGHTTEDTFLFAVIPEGVVSATVKVRAAKTQNGRTVYSEYSEVILYSDDTDNKPPMPANVLAANSGEIRVRWDINSGVDGWLVVCYGEDSTFTRPWLYYSIDADCNIMGWTSSWQPEKDNYFSVMSIRRATTVETYSDPVQFKFNINDGMTMLTSGVPDNNSSVSTPNSGGYVTVEYSNGVYVGEMTNDQANGYGTFTWDNGDCYEGQWTDNKQHGKGKMTWKSGVVYEGDWKDNQMTGSGKMTWENGDIYEGEFVNGDLVKGTMTENLSNGVYIYECDVFIDNKMSGPATRTIKYSSGDSSVLTGIAEDGEINGEGTLVYTFAGGSYFNYEGALSNGTPSGQGTKTTHYTDGTYLVESGSFSNGKLYNGTYTLYNSDGSTRVDRNIVNGS